MSTHSSPCAYCLDEGCDIVDPRELPCHHIFCYGCLKDALPTQPKKKKFKCPVCRIEHTLHRRDGIASLPIVVIPPKTPSNQGSEVSCADEEDIADDSCCDTCSRKGLRRAAVMFCQHCNLRLCASHNQSHDHLWGEHEHHVISYEEFIRQRDRLAARFCTEHNKQPLECVCVKCKKLFCLTCWAHAAMDCGDGEKHKIRPVLGVGEKMKKNLTEAVEPVILLQSKLGKLIIQSEKRLASAITELDGLTADLHKAMDLQLQEIRNAYGQLEERISKVREDTINQYRRYHGRLQDEMSRLQLARQEVDQVLASPSIIDVALRADPVILSLAAKAHSETELPFIQKVEMIPIRHCRLAEVDLLITAPEVHGAPPADIRALHLDKRITTGGNCYNVGHSAQGSMVVCREKGFDYLDITGNVTSSVELEGKVNSCCLYSNSVYLVHWENNKRWIRIYDMGGQLTHSWPVSGTRLITQLAVVGEMIILPNPDTKLIEVYSRSGDLMYSFTHPSFSYPSTVAAADRQHFVVRDYSAHLVSKFTISDHSLVWRYKDVHKPTGAAVDEHGRIWVASYDQKCVHVLSADGKLLVTLDLPHALYISGISVKGDQLAVATWSQKELLLYKITTWSSTPIDSMTSWV